ncbi:thioredoxin fold domain-containing protein [Flavobacterium litorale]|uniref:Thioredoxin family protein n=1 Tax=Flavobacterium litorale TaxID=2856519 RepID=A0ABX8V921_9FLAO|nr:thioredoxin fold domain-containing protein [Flavobacterium litorale]QYJ67164.1 thioredoxin family protein [Flavobacterium litorale]
MPTSKKQAFYSPTLQQFFIVVALVVCITTYAQKSYSTTFELLPKLMEANPKPIVIKLHASWCGICKIQDKKIEKDKELQELLKNSCYFIELDGELKETILYNGKEYGYKAYSKTNVSNELATELTQGNPSYPHWIFISANYEIIDTYGGLLKADDLKAILPKLSNY